MRRDITVLSVENTPSRPRSASTGRRHSSSRELVLRTVEAQSSPVSIAALASGILREISRVRRLEVSASEGITSVSPGSSSTSS